MTKVIYKKVSQGCNKTTQPLIQHKNSLALFSEIYAFFIMLASFNKIKIAFYRQKCIFLMLVFIEFSSKWVDK